MGLRDVSESIGGRYGIDWVSIALMIAEMLADCMENRHQFVEKGTNGLIFDRDQIRLRRTVRQHLGGENFRTQRRIARTLIAEYTDASLHAAVDATEAEAAAAHEDFLEALHNECTDLLADEECCD